MTPNGKGFVTSRDNTKHNSICVFLEETKKAFNIKRFRKDFESISYTDNMPIPSVNVIKYIA